MQYNNASFFELFTLFKKIEKGKLRIPNFQRDFVWDKKSIIELLESVYNGFPIGTIYFLESYESIFNSSTFEFGVKESEFESEYPIEYIIDGTQRLKTLYYCLYVNDDSKPAEFNIGFDPKRKNFIHLNNKNKPKYVINLTSIFSSESFMETQIELSKLKDSDTLLKEVNNLFHIFRNYQIPVITIANVPPDQVIEIFQHLNTTGKSLTKAEISRAVNVNTN